MMRETVGWVGLGLLVFAAFGCSSEADESQMMVGGESGPGTGDQMSAVDGEMSAVATGPQLAPVEVSGMDMQQVVPVNPVGLMPASPSLPAAVPMGTGGGMASGGGAPSGGDSLPTTPGVPDRPPAGAEDGDPATPEVTIPEVSCGGTASFLAGANHTIDGREMIVTYPCNKHEGAPMLFVLNLHGTTPVNLHFYQHGYFPIHAHAESHNLIVVTPSSVVQQWGNGDDGADEPHLMAIIDWVYSAFSKFDIRGMWVAGHSWGGLYTARFGCKPEIADKVVGLFMQSGGGVGSFGGASCADRVAVLISSAEGDGREPSDQSTLAASHGCDAAAEEMLENNKYTYWANCDPGFAHANYYFIGKEHADSMDPIVAKSAADWMQAARP